VANGLAQVEVAFPGFLGVVEREVADVHARLGGQLQVGVLFCQRNVGRVGELADVDVAGFEFQKADRVFRNGAENDFVQIGSADCPSNFELFQDDAVVLDPALTNLNGPVPTGLRMNSVGFFKKPWG
jgi:hypothetical protein